MEKVTIQISGNIERIKEAEKGFRLLFGHHVGAKLIRGVLIHKETNKEVYIDRLQCFEVVGKSVMMEGGKYSLIQNEVYEIMFYGDLTFGPPKKHGMGRLNIGIRR